MRGGRGRQRREKGMTKAECTTARETTTTMAKGEGVSVRRGMHLEVDEATDSAVLDVPPGAVLGRRRRAAPLVVLVVALLAERLVPLRG